jgi:hypothetical protein
MLYHCNTAGFIGNYSLKVVLPLVFKYRQDIIEGIICTLLKENKLTYTELYDDLTRILGSALSYRDFQRHTDKMVQEKRLQKEDSAKKGAKVFFSLTESAIKGYQLEVLGVNEKTAKQRILYQLIFLRETHGLDYSIYEQDLDYFLSNIPASRNNLVVDSEDEVEEIATFTYYKPIRGISIHRVSLKDSKYRKAETYYNISLPGVSIRDVINPNLGRRKSFPLPFDHIPFTEDEVGDGIYKLQNAKLIRPVLYINDEVRYSLVDNDFRKLLDTLYNIHTEKFGLMQHKWMFEPSTIEEYKQMDFIYGKKKAHKIMIDCYQMRQGIRKEIKENKSSVQQVQRFQSDYNLGMAKISGEIQKIKGKFSNTLSDYGFNQDFVENLLFEKIVQS